MKTDHLLLLLPLLLLGAGCSGRAEMRSVASQSSAILNSAQMQATSYADAQTRYQSQADASIAAFNKMTAIGNQELKSAQTVWIDSGMKTLYTGDLAPRAPGDYQKVVDDATAAPSASAPVTIDTSKVRQAVAKLNELAKEDTLESQLGFLTTFASAIANSYKDAQKKAADTANDATAQQKDLAPVQQ